jgi:O-antigen/teichoic acid export membrane protein
VHRFRRLTTGATGATVATGIAIQFAVLVSGITAARLLGPEDRGHLALIWLVTIALTQVGTLGMPVALTFEIARRPELAKSTVRLLRSSVVAQLIGLFAVHLALVFLLFGDEGGSVWTAAIISLAVLPAMVLQLYGLAVLQGREQFRSFNVLRFAPSALYAVCLSAMIVRGSGTLIEVTVVWVAAYVLTGLATWTTMVVALRQQAADHAPHATVRGIAAFGLRGMLGSFSPTETLRADQALVGIALSPRALGLYTTALAFSNLPRFIAQSIGLVAYPRAAAVTDRQRALALVWRLVLFTAVVTAVIVALIEVAVPWLIEVLFGPEFLPATDATRILLFGTFFVSVRRVIGDGLRGVGYPEIGTYAEVSSWVVLLPALIAVASADSIEAVAAAVAGSYVVSFSVILVLAARVQRRVSADHLGPAADDERRAVR